MEEKKNMNFFERVKTAVFKLENYGMFIGEKPSKAFKYFFTLVLFSVIIISLVSTFDFYRLSSKVFNYFENEIPEFSLENGILHFDEFVEGYDLKYDFRLIINTFDVGEQDLNDYNERLSKTGTGVLMLKDKFIIYSGGIKSTEYSYSKILDDYKLEITNKSDIESMIGTGGKYYLVVLYFICNVLFLYLVNCITILSDVCLVAIVGWFIARLCGMNVRMIGTIEIAIYSLTLSIILSSIYSSVNILTNSFRIEYFNLIYLLIAYVYLIAALFMIRDDLIKQKEELEKIYEVQKEVHKELEEKDKEEKETEESDKKEPVSEKPKDNNDEEKEIPEISNNNEPDGSEI